MSGVGVIGRRHSLERDEYQSFFSSRNRTIFISNFAAIGSSSAWRALRSQ